MPIDHRTSRRTFLTTVGAGVAAAVTGPTLLGATDKAGTKRPIASNRPKRASLWTAAFGKKSRKFLSEEI